MAKSNPDEKLPYSLQAEQAVLGTLLVRPDYLSMLPSQLRPDSFFRDAHGRIFSAMRKLSERRACVDMLTVVEELRRTDDIDAVGGPAYVSSLCDGVPSSTNVAHYAALVIEHATRRSLIGLAQRIIFDARTAETADDVLAMSQQALLELTVQTQRGGPVGADTLVAETFDAIQRAHDTGHGVITGLRTGLHDLDSLTCGFQRGDMVLVAARPSVGKTSFALDLGRKMTSTDDGYVGLIFSLEMTKQQLMLRLFSGAAQIEGHHLRGGYIDDEKLKRIGLAAAELSTSRLVIDDTAGLYATDLLGRARRVQMERKRLDFIIVDYVGLLRVRERVSNRNEMLTIISAAIKALAKELNVPVIALSQLSRDSERGKRRRPELFDLRDSGALEQDADVVIFLWREDDDSDVTEVIIRKQRNGPVGTVKLVFIKEQTRFESMAA